MSELSSVLFSDIFNVVRVNPEGKKFDKVIRLQCKGETYDTDLSIDVNCDVYPISAGEKISVAIASTLRLDGAPDDGLYDQSMKPTLLDQYDYGMSGRVFQYDLKKDRKVNIYASFGGLLMLLQGEQLHLKKIENDARVFCLIRKPTTK